MEAPQVSAPYLNGVGVALGDVTSSYIPLIFVDYVKPMSLHVQVSG